MKGAAGRAASPWLPHVMEIFALFMFLGIFTTLCIKETARKTLEELSGDDEYAETGAAQGIEEGGVLRGNERGEKGSL